MMWTRASQHVPVLLGSVREWVSRIASGTVAALLTKYQDVEINPAREPRAITAKMPYVICSAILWVTVHIGTPGE